MKPALFALVTFALGSALGWIMTRVEFASDRLAVGGAAAAGGSGYPAAKSGPKATVVNGVRYNFGTIDRFASDSHEFEVRNDGDQPLVLTLGTTTCKCTSFAFEKGQLEPGQATKVKLEWTVKTGDPMFEQSAELITNDPQNSPISLTIHGNVVDTVRTDRPQLSLGEVSSNEPHTARMRIHAYRSSELSVVKSEWSKQEQAEHFEVSFSPLAADELAKEPGALAGVELALTVKPGLPLGPLMQMLRVTTNLKDRDPLEIPIFGTIVSDVTLVGSGVNTEKLLVNFGNLEQGKMHTKTVFLVVKGPYRDQTELRIENVQPQDELQATLGEPLRDNPKIVRYPLVLEISESALPVVRNSEETLAQVKLGITHPQVKEMTVRVRYTLK
jgi:hypothetical protein